VYLGKPYRRIFEFAKAHVEEKFGDDLCNIAMVGDTPWTDVLGANANGIDSVMTLTGIFEDYFEIMPFPMSEEEKVDELFYKISMKIIEIDMRKLQQNCIVDDDADQSRDRLSFIIDNNCENMKKIVYPKRVIRRFSPISKH
jgi:hypothetical protein